jgi:hypothetical protein
MFAQLFWQYGNQHYQAKRWARATDWFTVGTHKTFRGFSLSKSYRKAALCYIQQGDFSRAIVIAKKCPKNEAATHYVVLIAAIQQGLLLFLIAYIFLSRCERIGKRRWLFFYRVCRNRSIRAAFSALRGIIKAPDCDRNMLLTTQLSHESNMRNLLLSTLEALLNSLKVQDGPDTVSEGIMLIRCIIRFLQSFLTEPAADA